MISKLSGCTHHIIHIKTRRKLLLYAVIKHRDSHRNFITHDDSFLKIKHPSVRSIKLKTTDQVSFTIWKVTHQWISFWVHQRLKKALAYILFRSKHNLWMFYLPFFPYHLIIKIYDNLIKLNMQILDYG